MLRRLVWSGSDDGGGFNWLRIGAGDEIGSANGAGDVRRKPSIDAIGMKDMIAFGKKTERFIVFELAQTNSALKRALADLVILDLGVDEGGESEENLRVKASLCVATAREGAGDRVDAGVGAESAAAAALTDVDREEAKKEEGADEDDDDDRHGWVEGGGVARCVAGVRLAGGAGGEDEEEKETHRNRTAWIRHHGERTDG